MDDARMVIIVALTTALLAVGFGVGYEVGLKTVNVGVVNGNTK